MNRVKNRTTAASPGKRTGRAVAQRYVVATLATPLLDAHRQNPRPRAALTGIGTDNMLAFWESMFAIGAQLVRTTQGYLRLAALPWWGAWTTPWLRTPARPPEPIVVAPAPLAAEPRTGKRRQRSAARVLESRQGRPRKRAGRSARKVSGSRKRSP